MIDIRIVCTHDALKVAETLMRLLEAEQHRVCLTYGRQAMAALEEARGERDAVLVIWSQDARTQTYMIEWSRNIEPWRLIEVSRTPDFERPHNRKQQPVIDFTSWRGERGGRAWDELNTRLRIITRLTEPKKPAPVRAFAALGVVAAAAVAGAVAQRVNAIDPGGDVETAAADSIERVDPSTGVGGPLRAMEPASDDESLLHFRMPARAAPIDATQAIEFVELDPIEEQHLRNETLLERISSLNPLRQRGTPEDGGANGTN